MRARVCVCVRERGETKKKKKKRKKKERKKKLRYATTRLESEEVPVENPLPCIVVLATLEVQV